MLAAAALMMVSSGNPEAASTAAKTIDKPRRRVQLQPSDPLKREIAEWNAAVEAKKAAKKARRRA
jgi:hypothetical protein